MIEIMLQPYFLAWVAKSALVFTVLILGVAVCLWAEDTENE